jgi:murein DD-endopeptidase MepM/ murein hydrolase activator NlpD
MTAFGRILVILCAGAVAIAAAFVYRDVFAEYVYVTVERVLVPYRMAELVALPPDETILMPIPSVRVQNVADTFGEPRGNDRGHEGQDIFARRGSVIFSATRGYVIRVGQNTLGGNVVSVLGAGRRVYYYAHLDSFGPDAVVGREVTPASILGFVGTTGNASGTPPHLHLGVYSSGGAINPLPLLVNRE